jgi:hypothetical protein
MFDEMSLNVTAFLEVPSCPLCAEALRPTGLLSMLHVKRA